MTRLLLLMNTIFTCLLCTSLCAQTADSSLITLQKIPAKYISTIDKKVTKYSRQISSKTEKTLEKLSSWEDKIKGMLQKISPATAEQLFGPGQQTFGSVLQRIKEGKQAVDNYQAHYDEYRDGITTDLKYLATQKEQLDQKILAPLAAAKQKTDSLSKQIDETEALEQFMQERKKQLINSSVQYIGNSKYLVKINKETWYYVETMKNYKEIFSDPQKAEETAKAILNKIPAFQKFFRKNSMLASLFGDPDSYGSAASMAGLQTRTSIQSLLQSRIGSGGSDAIQQVQQSIQQAQGQLSELKDKMTNLSFGNGGGSLPDFKPNMEKTKTFLQRLEFGTNMQSTRSNSYFPVTSDLGLSVGYKISDNSIAGIGMSYKVGWGKDISHIKISQQGIGLRSYLDIKAKGSIWITGGFEYNYQPAATQWSAVKNFDNWQKSALVGLTKKTKIGKKTTSVQLLYDLLCKQQVPQGQALKFRVGYTL